MPSDDVLQETLSRATVLLDGDDRDRAQGTKLLDDLRSRFPHRPEGEKARQLLLREQPPSWSAFDVAGGLDELETDWSLIRQPNEPRVRGLVERIFDPRRIGGERLDRLQASVLDFLALVNHETADPDLLSWIAELYDIAARHPTNRERAARDRDSIAGHLFRRRLKMAMLDVNNALERWDVEAAGAALGALGPATEDSASAVAELQARTAEILRRRTTLRKALDRAASATVDSPADATLLTATLDALAAHRDDPGLPEPLHQAIVEADGAAAAAVARWGAGAAGRARGLEGLTAFRQEWAKIPLRWQKLEQEAWFTSAWMGILEQTGATLARAEKSEDVAALAERFHEAALRLSEPLTGKARAVARTMEDFAHVWRQADAGIPEPMPDLADLAGEATLPKAFDSLRQAAEAADRILAEAEKALAAKGASTDADNNLSIGKELDTLCTRYPGLKRAQRLRKQTESIVARGAVRDALAAWRVEDAIAGMRLIDPSIDDESLDSLHDALDDFARFAAAPVNNAMAAQLTWWDGWLEASTKLPMLTPWPPGLDDALKTPYQNRLSQLSDAVDAELENPDKTAADFAMLVELFGRVADFPPLRFEMDRLHRHSLALEFEAAIDQPDWRGAADLLRELEAQGEPQERLRVLRLRMKLGEADAAGTLPDCLIEHWHNVQTLIPDQAPGLVLTALRGRRMSALEPTQLDRTLEGYATLDAHDAPRDSSMVKELAFWADWSALVSALSTRRPPTEDALLRASKFFQQCPSEWRQPLAKDVRRLIAMWKEHGDPVVLAWASRLFGQLDGVEIIPDPLTGLRQKAAETANGVVGDLTQLPLLSPEALAEPWRILRSEHDRWMALLRLLDAVDHGKDCSVPHDLAKAVQLVNRLAALLDEMKALEAADFRDAGLGRRIAHVRAGMIAVSETRSLLGLDAVTRMLNRIEQVCGVRHAWQDFERLCLQIREGKADLDGTNVRVRQRLEEILRILCENGAEDWPGGLSLLRDAEQCLSGANPAWPVAGGPTAAGDLLEFANQLCREEEKARAGLILIEQRLPIGSLGNPDDKRHDLFFQSLPPHLPGGSIARQLYRAFMRRDPMPDIVQQAPSRIPKWLRA